MYRHIKFNDNTEPCSDFLNGFCPSGKNCKSRHLDKASAPVVREIMKKKKSARKKKKEENDRNLCLSLNSEVVRLEFLEENEEPLLKQNNAKKRNLESYDIDRVETDLYIPLLSHTDENDFNDIEDETIAEEFMQRNGTNNETDNGCEKLAEKNGMKSNMREVHAVENNVKRKSLTVKFLSDDLDDDNHSSNGTYERSTTDPFFNSISSESILRTVAHDESEMETVEDCDVEVGPASMFKTVKEEAVEIIAEIKAADILQFLPTSFLFGMSN